MSKAPAKANPGDSLTRAERDWLTGDDPLMTESPFPSEEAERAAWEEHWKEMVEDARPGTRPRAYWKFEHGIDWAATWSDLPGVDSFDEFREQYPSGWSEQAAFLDAHDLLGDAERAAVERRVSNNPDPTSGRDEPTPAGPRGNGGQT